MSIIKGSLRGLITSFILILPADILPLVQFPAVLLGAFIAGDAAARHSGKNGLFRMIAVVLRGLISGFLTYTLLIAAILLITVLLTGLSNNLGYTGIHRNQSNSAPTTFLLFNALGLSEFYVDYLATHELFNTITIIGIGYALALAGGVIGAVVSDKEPGEKMICLNSARRK